MKPTVILITGCLLASLSASPQSLQIEDSPALELTVAEHLAASITAEDLKEHLLILASDEFEGRETGTPGNTLAANYIADVFKNLGLPAIGDDGSYFQKVAFSWTTWDNIAIEVNGQQFRHLRDFVSFPSQNVDAPEIQTDEIIFLGYGIDDPAYSDYEDVNVEGKVIMIYKNEPIDKKGNSYITGTPQLSDWSNDIKKKLVVAGKRGVKAVLIIDHEVQKIVNDNRSKLIGKQMTLGEVGKMPGDLSNHCIISTNIAKAIMGDQLKKVVKARKKINKKGKAKTVILPCMLTLNQAKSTETLLGQNVLGYIEGVDEKLKNELLIITAHYDHLGRRGDDIYNGADDNGSGTATVMDIAEAFSLAQSQGIGPKRSVLVMLVTGEEKGLLGSKYYSEHPIFPLANTIANVNVDMVGRVDEKHAGNPKYIYVIGSDRLSTELHQINEEANERYTQVLLDYTYNAPNDPNRYYYRSDHYNFAEKGIPAIFYFSGTHEDYHRTTDTVDKIDFDKMQLIGRLVFHTAWELANRKERIKVDVP